MSRRTLVTGTVHYEQDYMGGWHVYDDNYEPPDSDGVSTGCKGTGRTKAEALEDFLNELEDQHDEA